MTRPFFSVLMPAYNCESTVAAAVASVLADGSVPVEIVIVDDASTDTTPALLDALAARDDRVKVAHAKANRGDGPTRNAALELVTGEWLVLLDSDDLIMGGALKKLRDHIVRAARKADVYITRYYERDTVSNARWRLDECFLDDYAGTGPIDPSSMAGTLFSTVRSVIANKVWSIDYLREHKLVFQDIPRVGDVYFTLGTLAQAGTIEFADVELYEYRRNHGTSLTSTGDRYPLSFAEASEGLYTFLCDRGLVDTWRTGFLNWFNENTFYNLVSMRSLEGFAALLRRLQEKTFPLVRFDELSRDDAISKADYDRNVLLQGQTVDEALFAGLGMLFTSQEDQFFRAEFQLYDAENRLHQAAEETARLKDELDKANASLSMKVGLAATFAPRTIKAALSERRHKGEETRTIFSTCADPCVSVIVPACDAAPELYDCIESIIGQTFSNLELILVDDGSADATPGICDLYASRDPRITVVHQQQAGLSAARASGMGLARGEWVVFVDARDAIHPEFLSSLIGAALGTGSDAAVCGVQQFSGSIPAQPAPLHAGTAVLTGSDVPADEGGDFCYGSLWGKVYRKDLAKVGIPSGILGRCASIAEVGKVLYSRRA